ncbi:MAG: hypothetical protein FWB90_08505 [Fibromonadales bacterium]|nr:hypothetical protein [Fibromonadales bacterium]
MRKAYFCIDGFTFKRISDFYKYEHKRRSRLSVAAMETFLRYEIERRFEWKSGIDHLEVEKHFYLPYDNPRRIRYRMEVEKAILKFERALEDSGYDTHYARYGNNFTIKPNENIYAEWLIAKQIRKYDVFAIFTTQGQYLRLLQQTMLCEVPTILIGWDGACVNSSGEASFWKTDKALIGNASTYCPLERILNLPNAGHPFTDIMFERISCPKYPLNQRYG